MLTQGQVESELERIGGLLESATDSYAGKIVEAARAEAGYKSGRARSYLAAKGTQDERNAWAEHKNETALLDFKVAEAEAKALREKMGTMRAQLDYLRSLNANVRTQV